MCKGWADARPQVRCWLQLCIVESWASAALRPASRKVSQPPPALSDVSADSLLALA